MSGNFIEDKSRRCFFEAEETLKLLFAKMISELFLELRKSGYEVTESGKWDIVYVFEYFVTIILRRKGEIYVHGGFWVENFQEIPTVVLNYCNVYESWIFFWNLIKLEIILTANLLVTISFWCLQRRAIGRVRQVT